MKGKAEAILISPAGQALLKLSVINGTNPINVSNFPNGLYILSVTEEDNESKKLKLVIQH